MATISSTLTGTSTPAVRDSSQTGIGSSVGVADQRYGDGHMDWDGGGWFMFGMMAIFWVGVIALGWWGIASWNRHHATGPTGGTESPLDIVKRRYARGEISADEFERLKRDLG